MKISEVKDKLELRAITGGVDDDISGCYIGDLMSLAMANLQEGNIWITVQTNINAVAVSVLKEASCIIIADGFEPDNAALKKAEEEGLTIFASKKSVYDLAKQLGELGI